MPTEAAIVLRPRNDWEAADLGLELARAWAGAIARLWAVAYLGPAVAAVLLSPWPVPTALLAWWLRPCAERGLMEVLARRTFQRPHTVGDALTTIVRLLRTPGPFVASLTWRRLSPIRTLWLAVWHLEGLRGRAARDRIAILAREGRGVALWCLTIGAIATVLLLVTVVVVLLALLPDATGTSLQAWLAGDAPMPLREARLWATLAIVADALCAPWITAAVFGLYVSRRTDLEAWDLEQVFRGLSRRLPMLGVLVAAMWLAAVPQVAWAQAPPPPGRPAPTTTAPPFDPEQAIEAILAEPEFGRPETIHQWRFRTGRQEAPAPAPAWLTWLLQKVPGISAALRWGMWMLAAVLIGWLALTTWRGRARQARPQDEAPPTLEFETMAAPARAPRDVAGRVRDAIADGAVVEALGLLYAGVLHACVERGVLDLHPGDTEGECLRRVRGHLPHDAECALFDVVKAWQAAAYARRMPTGDQVLAMCDAYVRHFEGAPA